LKWNHFDNTNLCTYGEEYFWNLFPVPGVEPRPPWWEPGILTAWLYRRYGLHSNITLINNFFYWVLYSYWKWKKYFLEMKPLWQYQFVYIQRRILLKYNPHNVSWTWANYVRTRNIPWWMKEMITVFTETRNRAKPLADAYGVNTANGWASKRTRFGRREKSHRFRCERWSRSQLTLGEGRVHPGEVASPSQGTHRDRQAFMLTFTPIGNLEIN